MGQIESARRIIAAVHAGLPPSSSLVERMQAVDAACPHRRSRRDWPYVAWLRARREYLRLYGLPAGRNARRALRTVRVEDGVAYVPLTRGLEARVDATDLAIVQDRTWNACPAARRRYCAKSGPILMHRLILDPAPDMEVAHLNGDLLDNRRANLRLRPRGDEFRNGARPSSKTPFRGLEHNPRARARQWRALIRHQGRRRFLGNFATPEAAARAYDAAARRLLGDTARLNFPEER
jgi:hypothetical protein